MAENKAEAPKTEATAKASANDEKHAAVTGAQAVADAVSKVANAAVDAVRGTDLAGSPKGDFHFSGTPGGYFQIRGQGFGGGGAVTVGGRDAVTTAWGGERIEGKMPAEAKSGDEVVIDSSGKKQYGQFV